MLSIILWTLKVCFAAHLKYLLYLLCANEKINESRSKYALTTSLTLNYSFMLKCCKRSPIIWFNENACNGMHAANKLIRPLASYKGNKHRKVVQLNQR